MIAWVLLLIKELEMLCKAAYIMPVIDFNPNMMPTQVSNSNTIKLEFSIACKKGTTEGWCDPWCQRPWRRQGGEELKKRIHSDNGWEVWRSFQMCCTDRGVWEEMKSLGKIRWWEKWRFIKWRTGRRAKVSVLRGNSLAGDMSMGKQRRGPTYKWGTGEICLALSY